MKQITTLILLLFLLQPIFGQKTFDIPETPTVKGFINTLPEKLKRLGLKDLQTSSDSLNIRIWKPPFVFTANYTNTATSSYKVYTRNRKFVSKPTNFSEKTSQKIINNLLSKQISKLKDDQYRGIDGHFVFIEFSTKSKYKIVSYWSPNSNRSNDNKTVVQILGMLRKETNSSKLIKDFLNSLEPGSYAWGMSNIRLDNFVDEKETKTNFYSQAEEKIKAELNITKKTNRQNYPLILINGKPAKMSDLNTYTNQQVAKFEIIKPNDQRTVLYGTNGNKGIVIVQTK